MCVMREGERLLGSRGMHAQTHGGCPFFLASVSPSCVLVRDQVSLTLKCPFRVHIPSEGRVSAFAHWQMEVEMLMQRSSALGIPSPRGGPRLTRGGQSASTPAQTWRGPSWAPESADGRGMRIAHASCVRLSWRSRSVHTGNGQRKRAVKT